MEKEEEEEEEEERRFVCCEIRDSSLFIEMFYRWIIEFNLNLIHSFSDSIYNI
jgi:hypothetical protein